jgi:hypothetical protein
VFNLRVQRQRIAVRLIGLFLETGISDTLKKQCKK